MPICVPEDLTDHEVQLCTYRKGGISAIGILLPGYTTVDFSDAVEVQADITADLIKIVKTIKADLPAPTAVEGENVVACGSDTIVDGYDYVLNIKDFNVTGLNDTFYKILNNTKTAGIILYFCEEDEIRVVTTGVTFNAALVLPASNKEKQYYQITAKWSASVGDEFPTLLDAPAGIFV